MKAIDILFFFIIIVLIGLDIFDYFRPDVLIGLQVVNALALAMLGYIIAALSHRLAHVPIQEKYIKPSRKRRRV